MSKTNKQKELTRGELKSRKRMYKAKKNWVVAGATVAMGIMALGATVESTTVHAEEWTANSTEQVASRIAEGQTSLTMENGDTVWEIGQAINIANPMNLLKDNGIAEGQQYTLEIGTVISWDGNHVTVKDSNGTVIGDKIVTDDEKVDSSKTVANQESDTPQARGGQLEDKTVAPEQAETPVAQSATVAENTPQLPELPSVPVVDNGTGNQETPKLPELPQVPSTPEKPAEKPVTPTPVEKFNVTINYVDTEGNTLAKSDVVSVEKGKKYTAIATTIKDYTLVGEGSQTVMVDGNKEITFTYKADEVTPPTPVEKFNVTTNFVDESGNVIADKVVNEVEAGTEFTATAKNIDGYTLKGEATQTVTVDGNTTVTFTYSKNAVTPPEKEKFDVTVNFVDTDGNTIADKDVVSIEEGQEYTATAKTIDGYTLNGTATQTVTVDGNKTVTFTYTKNVAPVEKFNVTVNYVDTEGNEIATPETTNDIEKGTEFTANAKVIDKYSVRGDATQTITVNGNETITFVYEKVATPVEKFNVTVQNVDTDGNVLSTEAPVEVEAGTDYTATAKAIEGYTLQGDSTQTVIVDGNKTITFTYTKDVAPVKQYDVTVEYVDTEGNILDKDNAVKVNEGLAFKAYSKEFDGYTLIGKFSQTITVTEDTTITFVYEKDAVAPIVDKSALQTLVNNVQNTEKGNYTDSSYSLFETNLGVAQQVLADTSATQAEVDNAKTNLQTSFDNLVENAPEVKEFTVTTNFVTTDGTTLDTATNTVKDGESFTATAKTFDGYTLQGDSTQTVTVDGNKTVTFTYKKDVVAPTQFTINVQYVDTDGNVLQNLTPVKMTAGMKYTVTADEIDGYTLVGEASQSITVSKDETLTFTYKKDEVTPPTQDVATVEAQIASQTMNLINDYRNQNGLKSLRSQAQIQNAVNDRANEIVTDYSHNNTTGGMGMDDSKYGYNGMSTGENIGRYNNPSSLDYFIQNGASLAFNAWKNSPDHNAYMLATDITEGAVGIHLEDTGSGKYTMFSVFIGGLQDNEWGNDNSLGKSRSVESTQTSETEAVAPQSATIETEEAPVTEETTNKVSDTTLSETPEVTEESTVETPAVEEATTEEATAETQTVEATPVNPLAVGNFDELFATKAEAEAKAMEQVKLEGGEWFNTTFKVTEVEMTDGTVQYGIDFTASQVIQNGLETSSQVLTVDKEKLKETYNLAISLDEQNYTVHSWSNLMFKVADAKQVFDNADVTQQQVDDAVFNLQKAINDLV